MRSPQSPSTKTPPPETPAAPSLAYDVPIYLPKRDMSDLVEANRRERIINMVRLGNKPNVACMAEGIPAYKFSKWIRLAGQGVEPYQTFALELEKAAAEAQVSLVLIARRACEVDRPGNPALAIELLGRRFPKDWAPKFQVAVKQELEGILGRLEAAFQNEPEIFDRILAVLATEPGALDAPAAPRLETANPEP